jgi:hypothetical protein
VIGSGGKLKAPQAFAAPGAGQLVNPEPGEADMHKDSSNALAGSTIRYGKRAPAWTPVPEWLLLSDITAQAKTLYSLLLAHVNREREDGFAWPTFDQLAKMMGFKHRNSINKYLTELVTLQAVDIERRSGFDNRNYVYLVNELPPDDYMGFKSINEFHKANKPVPKLPMHTSVCVDTHTTMGVDTHTVVCHNQTNQTTRRQPDELTSGDAYAANRQILASPDEMRIFVSDKFWGMTDGHAQAALIRGAVKTMNKNGVQLRQDGRKKLSDKLTALRDGGWLSRAQQLETLRDWLTDELVWSEFACWPETRAA